MHMDPLSQMDTAVPSLQSLSFHPILTMSGGAWENITHFKQRRTLRWSNAWVLSLLQMPPFWVPSLLGWGLSTLSLP